MALFGGFQFTRFGRFLQLSGRRPEHANETGSFTAATLRCMIVGSSTSAPASSAAAPKVPSPRRGEARTEAILHAAIELLSEVGFDRMTMDAVATRAKASKATIYRRWPDKTELVLEALRRRGSVVPEVPDSGSLRADLDVYVRAAAASAAGIDGRIVTGLLAGASHDPELAAMLGQQFHYLQLPTFIALVERARERGGVGPAVDPALIGEILGGALIMHLLVLGLPADEAFIARLIDGLLLPTLEAGAKPAGGR